MNAAVAAANVAVGLTYLQVGAMGAAEMVRNRRSMGFSQFGAAWIAVAFTCGPHHLVHGVHVAEGRAAGLLDLVTVLAGLPAGLAWVYLRIEASRGGRGDRFVRGNPPWVLALPTIAGMYATALVAAAIGLRLPGLERVPPAGPNLLLLGVYSGIAFLVARTQIANRRPLGGWSLSGLALAAVFATCGVMHAAYALQVLDGRYVVDVHGLVVDGLAVAAGLYFLWVVRALSRGAFSDWNGRPLHARRVPERETAPA